MINLNYNSDNFGSLYSIVLEDIAPNKQLKQINVEPKDKNSVLWQEWKILQEGKNNV